jgi:hypothetical protein
MVVLVMSLCNRLGGYLCSEEPAASYIFTLKLNASGSSETPVTKTKCYHIPEDHNLYFKLVTCFGNC